MDRPITISIIGWLFIAAGAVGFVYHLSELSISDPFVNDVVIVLFVRLLAIVGGILILRKESIGRWLLVAWLAYHVVLSYSHPLSQLVIHALLFVAITYGLFNRRASTYFKS